MPPSITSRSRSWVALAAAYLLVMQALVAGFATGTSAHGAAFDRALVLTHCAPSGDAASGESHDGMPGHAGMACCTLCLVPAADGPARAPFVVLSDRPVDQVAFARHLDRPVGYLAVRSPGNPRAPPASV